MRKSLTIIFGLLMAPVLATAGCAVRADKTTYGQPYTHDVSLWRQYLGAAIALQFFLLALALWNSDNHPKLSRMFLSLLLVPLLWTYPAELVYRLQVWILDWGLAGHLLAMILGFAGGMLGTLSVFSYLLGGFVFSDTRYLLYWTMPGVIAGYTLSVWYIVQWRLGRRRLSLPLSRKPR